MLAQLAVILGALLFALGLCLAAGAAGILTVAVRRPARPRPPKEPTP
jgi:hypothetical protein